ncbi:hypothetical protein CC79DRAFT_1370687 [Sarocladium strictum]
MNNLADGETHVFKRDAEVPPHVIELAERDNIDLSQMYRHSMIKRDDGEHVTVWVHNSYDEEDDTDVADDLEVHLAKRQSVRPNSSFDNRAGRNSCQMNNAAYTGDTGPGAPFTGGAAAIVNWSSGCRGRWFISGSAVNQDLLVAGSNSGGNMRFTIRVDENINAATWREFGCGDVGNLVRTSRERFQRVYNGRERVRARGTVPCNTVRTMCYKNLCQPVVGNVRVIWAMDNTSARV